MKNNSKVSSPKYLKKSRSKAISETLFICLLTIGLVYLLALFTHSTNENPWSGDVELITPMTNIAGVLGVYLSDVSLSIFGYSAYIIPIALIWLGWNIHKNINQNQSHWFVSVVRVIALVIFIAFSATFLTQNFINIGAAGGYVGNTLHMYFSEFFGYASLVVYLSIMMVSFSIASRASWMNIFSFVGKAFINLFSKTNNISKVEKVEKIDKVAITPKPSAPINVQPIKPKPNKTTKHSTSVNVFNAVAVVGLPSLDLLDDLSVNTAGYSKDELQNMSHQVEVKLKDFGFDVSITTVTPGPVVIQFEVSLAPGVKVAQIMNLSKDLARALLVESVRIVDVIPGKPVIGLEIPNSERDMISLKEVLSTQAFSKSSSMLTMGLGKDINGLPIVVNLAKMPHLLVAGATGMGKSVGLNAMILSVLYKAKPDEVRMIMIDPKIVELACYADIPHLLTPVVTDMNQAASALWWCVNEMERRYVLLAEFGVRNVDSFNEKLKKAKNSGQLLLDPSFNSNTAAKSDSAPELESLPLIVLVIEEYADMLGALMQEDRAKANRAEALIVRLAQKARAAGIHLIIATQRPSVDVITGLIKSNVPTRIAFKVSSKVDSRTILDQSGAEQLLGMGDMLYMTPSISHLTRVHGAFVSDDEIARVVGFLKESSETNYINGVINAYDEINNTDNNIESVISGSIGELDPLYDEAVQIVTKSGRASISSLQRRMRIGYNRAARIIEDMEASGVVSTMNSAGNRQVLAPTPLDTDD